MKALLMVLMAGVILLMAQSIFARSSKVQICHIPPGNTGNFHTITVSEKALGAHLAHGDLSGPCFEAGEILCDDGNACTIDAIDPETGTCMAEHSPVDCIDGLGCTTDSCDPAVGCQYAPIVCDDGDLCTVDACSEFDGQCTSTAIDCGPLGNCLSNGLCDFPCDGITCEPIDQCHVAGQCVLPGECDEGVEVADGTPCDDGEEGTTDDQCSQGACVGTPVATCPCFNYEKAVHAVQGLKTGTGPKECNRYNDAYGNPDIRYIRWDIAPGQLGTSLGVKLSSPTNCQYTDWETAENQANPITNHHLGGWGEMYPCVEIMDAAVLDENAVTEGYCLSLPTDP